MGTYNWSSIIMGIVIASIPIFFRLTINKPPISLSALTVTTAFGIMIGLGGFWMGEAKYMRWTVPYAGVAGIILLILGPFFNYPLTPYYWKLFFLAGLIFAATPASVLMWYQKEYE